MLWLAIDVRELEQHEFEEADTNPDEESELSSWIEDDTDEVEWRCCCCSCPPILDSSIPHIEDKFCLTTFSSVRLDGDEDDEQFCIPL